ncbi:putative manganese-dependent inorganic diphosphatase [Coraliomargarita akajimensis]|uniref:inorganic diphosphatase n=1 Tax=Coraliomargarita akajimensis (strain DSM 45221 / IAM 15411 / JCM 23193 / KCTC 12865 / 04OKA010-24) TaxID=583355 RepID=D5EQH1_CORAD|nr:putative manganese-dependent inorganic diphosphatase [Coraliomargarita akajimensis]ADE55785.1 Inorganic diphosphatase [Coraliomargarita akajimensis DSM 45221]
MPDPIYILGHKNPDADAICSAIAYEAYKHAIGQTEYVAARCGNSNARIDAILERFETPLPQFIGDVTPRIADIMTQDPLTVTKDSTCAEALEIIDEHDVRALPVVDPEGQLEGTISIFQLGESFIPKPRATKDMRRVHTSISAIIRSLNATVLNEINSDSLEELYVRVGAMDIRSFGRHHQEEGTPAEQSIIIVGDRWDIQERCLQLGVRLLVITGGLEVEPDVIERAKKQNVSLIVSPYDSASTSWIIRSATHINQLIDPEVKCFTPEDRISSVKGRIANVNDPLYMVVNEHQQLLGVFSKSDILRPSNTRIALVDHNEIGQAVNGASEVQITEILDHHRLGNVPTDQPILFINRPVGSTCSIVADMFRNQGLTPSPSIAGIMMSGIISDTLLLNSPTTTELEGELLNWLSPIAGISAEELAELIFSSGSVILNHDSDAVVNSDCKVYANGELHYSVSQIEELGFNNFWEHVEALNTALENYRASEGLFFSFLLVTDINTQDSLLLVAGSGDLKRSINYPQKGHDNIYDLPGIVSRKKQLIPYISSLLKTMGLIEG